jgi:hypothetical protein
MLHVHLQQSSNAIVKVEAKKKNDIFARTNGVHILSYHAHYSKFVKNAWQAHIKLTSQSMTYAGVGAQHQNGIAEKRIRDLQDLATLALIHAMKQLPNRIFNNLCPHALRKSNIYKATESNPET